VHLNNARYDKLGATLSLVFSEARMSVKASETKSQSSNARSVMPGWESKTRMKIPLDAMNWLVILDHARHVGLYRLKSTLAINQIRVSVCSFDCVLRKMIANTSLLSPSHRWTAHLSGLVLEEPAKVVSCTRKRFRNPPDEFSRISRKGPKDWCLARSTPRRILHSNGTSRTLRNPFLGVPCLEARDDLGVQV